MQMFNVHCVDCVWFQCFERIQAKFSYDLAPVEASGQLLGIAYNDHCRLWSRWLLAKENGAGGKHSEDDIPARLVFTRVVALRSQIFCESCCGGS